VTIAVLGIAVVVLLAGLASAIRLSDFHRKAVTVESVLRGYAEALSDPGVAYVPCATTSSYTSNPPNFTLPTGITVVVQQVRYWNGASPAGWGSCTVPTDDRGVQLLTIKANASDGRATKTFDVVKRATS